MHEIESGQPAVLTDGPENQGELSCDEPPPKESPLEEMWDEPSQMSPEQVGSSLVDCRWISTG
ncbi:MAG: hypothetical protein NT039_01910 [Candidatus Berkelbacteria bacterium]|nr:hypothetical protein [Candidatus Berkelbacteria bacterium]